MYQSIYINFYSINLKTRLNRKIILSFMIELPSSNIINIKINTNAYYIYLQFLIFNINTDIFIFLLKIGKNFVQLKTNLTNNFIL